MEQMVIAVDVDGTLYDGAGVAPEALDALQRAKRDGHHVVIVTGRRWEKLRDVVPEVVALCDRVVCEEGAVLVDVGTGAVTLLAAAVSPELVRALEAAGVSPLDIGRAVVGAPSTSRAVVRLVLDQLGSRRLVIVNKSSIAIAPGGCDKGTGLRAAMADLGLLDAPTLAIGDASNDIPMLAIATIAVGVANADDTVRASGAHITRAATGRGVAEALERYLLLPNVMPAGD